MEIVAAAVVIGFFCVFAGGSPATHHEDAQLRWNSRALPALTQLVGDLGALAGDAGSGTAQASSPGLISRDATTLRADLASARSLGPPPGPELRAGWAAALARVGSAVAAGEATVAAAGGAHYTAQVTTLRSAVADAGDTLLRLASGLRSAS